MGAPTGGATTPIGTGLHHENGEEYIHFFNYFFGTGHLIIDIHNDSVSNTGQKLK